MLIIALIVTLFIPASAQKVEYKYYDIALSEELQDELFALCEEYGVDEKLMLAVMFVESSYRTDVISITNDYGLMQINKINHKWLGKLLEIDDFLDPVQNMKAGVYLYSSYMLSAEGNIHKSAMMYKCGEYGAKRLFDRGIYENTYSRKVVKVMGELKLK